jgi:tRNA threonylcarbamoyladenosine biosynthesis protein TsaB
LRLLAFDAAQEPASASVAGCPQASLTLPRAAGATEELVPMLLEATRRAGWALCEVEQVAVGVGPGGYTGVRVAVASARALALATRAEIWPVSYFLMGLAAAREAGWGGPVEVLKDIRREQLMRQRFGADGPEGEPEIMAPEAARLLLARGQALALGDAVEGLGLPRAVCGPVMGGRSAAELARLAVELGLARRAAPEMVRPVYARPPDARPGAGALLAGLQRP